MACRGGAMAVLRAPTSFAARTAAKRQVPSSWMRVARLQQQHGQLQPIAVPAQAGKLKIGALIAGCVGTWLGARGVCRTPGRGVSLDQAEQSRP